MSVGETIPTWARTHLAHAAVEVLAQDAGCDILHVKGPAARLELRPDAYGSTDADIIVRPDHVRRFMSALRGHGWTQFISFERGSAWRHAASLRHDSFGNLDVHRFYPGLGSPYAGQPSPADAFDVLHATHELTRIAGIDCRVPDEVGQALVLLLHDARNPASVTLADTQRAWTDAPDERRAAIRDLAERTGSTVALAAAIDELEEHTDAPDYLLWRHFRHGGSRLDEWHARLAAAPSRRAKTAELVRALGVNRDHLEMSLGREVTTRELARETAGRYAAAARALARTARARLGRGGRASREPRGDRHRRGDRS